MGAWFAILLAAAIVAVVGFRALAKRSVLHGRTPEALESIYRPVKDQVSLETFREVLTLLGRAYSVNAELLRPTDTFAALGKIDSWTLGKAEDDIGKWLKERGIETPSRLDTVLDLARCVEAGTKAR